MANALFELSEQETADRPHPNQLEIKYVDGVRTFFLNGRPLELILPQPSLVFLRGHTVHLTLTLEAELVISEADAQSH